MKLVKPAYVLVGAVLLLFWSGCGISEEQHRAALQQQADHYEQQLREKEQRISLLEQQIKKANEELARLKALHSEEVKSTGMWFASILLVNNLAWLLAYRRKQSNSHTQ